MQSFIGLIFWVFLLTVYADYLVDDYDLKIKRGFDTATSFFWRVFCCFFVVSSLIFAHQYATKLIEATTPKPVAVMTEKAK